MIITVGKTYRRVGDSARMKVTEIKNGMVSYTIEGGRYSGKEKRVGFGLTRMDVFHSKCAKSKVIPVKRIKSAK